MKIHPSTLSRREFLALTGTAALSVPAFGQDVLGANDRVRIALVGCGGRSNSLYGFFTQVPGVEVVAVCDPDTSRMAKYSDRPEIKQYQDYRKLYERNDIDAVVIASTNSWHALHAIQAMESGKDVYVEKPVSYGIWEGQQLVAAEKKYDRIAMAGFQNRSDPGPQQGIQFVQEGNLGKILSVHSCCFRNRNSIGPRTPEAKAPPSTCDYNLWLGPAEDRPIHRNKFHYDWHWIWNTGNGDIGNQGPHEIDLVSWVLGDGPLPREMHSVGGRFGWNDAGETPNLMTAWYEQAGVPVIIEVNDLKLAPDRNVPSHRNGIRVGVIVRCEGGELRGGRGGMVAVGEDGKTHIKKFGGDGGRGHQKNFIDAVRSRDRASLTSNLQDAERSSAVAHLANLSLRSGGGAAADAVEAAAGGNETLQLILNEQKTQLAAWGIESPTYTLGSKLSIDPDRVTVSGPGLDPALVRRDGRGEFKIPELV